ncbi:MAG: DUF4760 domain-containing protein [Candidatus Eremiobacteraeota bacterium]|nr:DUF4760 domain-containing protein [Candidatus Eremiobacteraeota bacterium]MBV8262434.1 DUF4760 domain-containing protein [Candidatus Eremiobacteraeota bacterium]MBV8459574.1 DUF4760 domain-containing protein [Candidatus Eremiobacteraeota bacterium]MBV8669723.1 DUF4760 domain-containing protein [Candidatus Eremiobacteraeota bacterium]
MTAELLSAIFAGATFVVIAASAVAAIVQLRHLRTSNQLEAMMEINRRWNDPEFLRWLTFVRTELPRKMEDPEFRAGMVGEAVDRQVHVERYVGDYFEQIGTYAKYGLIDERSFLDIAFQTVIDTWERLWPVTRVRREASGPAIYENFEYLAVRARQWQQRHPHGAYPAGVLRYGPVSLPQQISADPHVGMEKDAAGHG